MTAETASEPLQTLGDYRLVEVIAEGGMGKVYKGVHRSSGERAAIKVVPRHLLSNPVYLRRFEQEYNAARALNHPNIVKALEFGHADDCPYLVMEYVEGESLGQRLERDGKLDEAQALRIITQVAEGLQQAHQLGLIHRDVKPDNILLTRQDQAKLTDLGLVKELDADSNLTRTGRGLGTPHFMAPEQFRNAKNADVRCDIYSLGATLYMMVTGELPFRSNSPLDAWMKKISNDIAPPRELNPALSERVDRAIRRAMDPEASERPASCAEFLRDLQAADTETLGKTDPNVEQPDRWYLCYKDAEGAPRLVKGKTSTILRALTSGALGPVRDVRVAKTKTGPYHALNQVPEFCEVGAAEKETTIARPQPRSTPRMAPKVSARELEAAAAQLAQHQLTETVPPAPAPAAAPSAAPHAAPHAPPSAAQRPNIHLPETRPSRDFEGVKVSLFILAAALTGVAAYFLAPHLTRVRWF